MPRPYQTDPARRLIRIAEARRARWAGGHASRAARAASRLLSALEAAAVVLQPISHSLIAPGGVGAPDRPNSDRTAPSLDSDRATAEDDQS